MQIPGRSGIRIITVAGLVTAVLFVGHELELHLPDLETRIGELGVFAPVGFIALFVGLSPVFVSIDALCIASGLKHLAGLMSGKSAAGGVSYPLLVLGLLCLLLVIGIVVKYVNNALRELSRSRHE